VLVGKNWQGAPLAELVRQQLGPFVEILSSRFEFVGPDIVVTAEAAQAIGLAIHELATNAIKYGALSAPTGKVRISWMFDGNAGASSNVKVIVELNRAGRAARDAAIPQRLRSCRDRRHD
jgi:two-component sensor histidine kinase